VTVTDNGVVGKPQRYHYDGRGRLWCVVAELDGTVTQAKTSCPTATGAPQSRYMVAAYAYDYLDRLEQLRTFHVALGVDPKPDDLSVYGYDALDRLERQREQHQTSAGAFEGDGPRTTTYTYLGLTAALTSEVHTAGIGQAPGAQLRTKTYSYDTAGTRIAMTNTPAGGAAQDFTYAYDVHGSVSQLIADGGAVSAGYGYSAYGQADEVLSQGDDDDNNPFNPYRYTGKRLDSGSGQYGELDMGARRFSPATTRFLQDDAYSDALANLGLASDPLTSNRYALAGGNPLSFIEWDGHVPQVDGAGRSYPAPTVNSTDYPLSDDSAAWDTTSKRARVRGGTGQNTGSFRPLEQQSYQSVGAERVQFDAPVLPGRGLVLARFFISGKTSGGLLEGDDRGFTSDPLASNRVTFAYDTESGALEASLSRSCFAGAPARLAQTAGFEKCTSALPINTQGSPNKVSVQSQEDAISIKYHIINSITGQVPGRPVAIDGSIVLARNEGGSFDVGFVGDQYSSLEIYQYLPGRRARTLATLPEESFSSAFPPQETAFVRLNP
jgi:RHS repeat-associated protein